MMHVSISLKTVFTKTSSILLLSAQDLAHVMAGWWNFSEYGKICQRIIDNNKIWLLNNNLTIN